ncbi:MAG: ATP synthase F1 subunit gamma [Lachnospiraceae bacterium]|nr:ATP synthase F1 subunit gamma [Lachnospiraceae bacterium]
MASMRDIKRRKSSIQSTQQITKAMKLVSTVKLQKAKAKAEESKPYFQTMYQTIGSILSKSGAIQHPYLVKNDSNKKAVIAISANRGLAGGYNTNLVKLVTGDENLPKEDVVIYNIGSKGREIFLRKGYEIKADYSEVINQPLYKDAVDITQALLKSYRDGEIGEIYLAYTSFKNTVSHIPTLIKLLPMDQDSVKTEGEEKDSNTLMNYEPEPEEALEQLIPKYVSSLIYGAFSEAVASENGARMQAMDSATSNAEEMIAGLSLMYNRARQTSITQELTEIIAGADAIN